MPSGPHLIVDAKRSRKLSSFACPPPGVVAGCFGQFPLRQGPPSQVSPDSAPAPETAAFRNRALLRLKPLLAAVSTPQSEEIEKRKGNWPCRPM